MKKINPTLAVLIALAYLLASCDYIENNYYECTINQTDTLSVSTAGSEPGFVGSSIDTNGDLGYTYQIQTSVKAAGYKYFLYMGLPVPEVGAVSGYYKAVAKTGVDFLTNVITFCENTDVLEEDAIIEFRNRGLFYSSDFNYRAGGDYVRIGFQGQSANAAFSYTYNHTDKRQSEDKVITGLRLVTITSDKSNIPETITDEFGVKWYKAPSYHGYSNMNNDAGGDDLYLYYTKEYTGEQVTIVNPYYIENYERLKNDALMTNLLGGISSWSGSDSNSWRPSCDDLRGSLGSTIWNKNQVEEDDLAIQRNVKFVRLYDRNMDLIQGDEQYRPANWNRNAGGDKMFLSYSYIEEDSPYWINQ